MDAGGCACLRHSKQQFLSGIELIVVDAACVVQPDECGKLANNVNAGNGALCGHKVPQAGGHSFAVATTRRRAATTASASWATGAVTSNPSHLSAASTTRRPRTRNIATTACAASTTAAATRSRRAGAATAHRTPARVRASTTTTGSNLRTTTVRCHISETDIFVIFRVDG